MNNIQFYNNYNYPDVKEFKKKHINLMKKILYYSNLTFKDLNGKKILDAGCGTGDKAIFFSGKGANVTAIDISRGQLIKAKEKASKKKADVKFIRANILDNNLEKIGKFDYIFCLGVLHHTKDAKKGFENLCKLLNPNGTIIIGLYHKYARLRYRIIRKGLRLFISRKPEKIINFLFSKNYFAKKINTGSKETIYDRYAVPFESYHTLKEVKVWFKRNNIKEIKHSENVNGFEPLRIFEKKTLFFISGKKIDKKIIQKKK